MNLKEVKTIFSKYRIFPSKRLGQNFLIDEKILKKIVKTANLSKSESVVEVGPGFGNLTLELAKRVKKVIAIEKDKKMVEVLKETLKDSKNIKIVNEDILKWEPKAEIRDTKYKVAANIPYYLTSPLIRKFLETENKPKEMILMIQKEVAQRICAKIPKMNLLAVSVQFYAKPEIINYVSKKSFWPQPKVDSAILRISQIRTGKKIDARRFFKVVKAGFSQPRKQLINNLEKKLGVDKIKIRDWLLRDNIQPSQRAESLSLDDWLRLTSSFNFDKI